MRDVFVRKSHFIVARMQFILELIEEHYKKYMKIARKKNRIKYTKNLIATINCWIVGC